MTITTTWQVVTCDFEDKDGQSKVITRVKARVTASNGTDSTNARTHNFTLGAPGAPFVEFDDIADEATIMSFVDADEKAEAEASAEVALADLVAKKLANTGSGLPAGLAG